MDPQRMFKGILFAQFVICVIALAISAAIIYCAVHFIGKVW